MDGGDTPSDTGNTQGGIAYDVGFSIVLFLFLSAVCYTTYVCKHRKQSPSPPPPTNGNDPHHHLYDEGLDEDILSTFPTFRYSDKDRLAGVDYVSGCSVCLADYRARDVIRLLPECGHFFHVRCIDTWLMAHPTCPVCRKSPLPAPTELT